MLENGSLTNVGRGVKYLKALTSKDIHLTNCYDFDIFWNSEDYPLHWATVVFLPFLDGLEAGTE